MAAAAILHFSKTGILGHSNPAMVIIYLRTKLEAIIFISDRVIDKNSNQRWRPSPSGILVEVGF